MSKEGFGTKALAGAVTVAELGWMLDMSDVYPIHQYFNLQIVLEHST